MINYRTVWLKEFFHWVPGDFPHPSAARIISSEFLIYFTQRSGDSTGEAVVREDVSEVELE